MADVVTKAPAIDRDDFLIQEYGYDDHFHEHHHGDKYQSNFITTYIFSQDHKMIAKQFLITGMIWAIIGAAMSLIFRMQLGFPEEKYGLDKTIAR
jgi:cytochrome c oxidase subunit 1